MSCVILNSKNLLVSDLIKLLETFPKAAEVVLEDLNGLHWAMENSLVGFANGVVVIGSQNINLV